jgi:hypothetical protein
MQAVVRGRSLAHATCHHGPALLLSPRLFDEMQDILETASPSLESTASWALSVGGGPVSHLVVVSDMLHSRINTAPETIWTLADSSRNKTQKGGE